METSQATKLKKGVKRLSLICGGLGVTIWGFLCFMEIIHFRAQNPWGGQNPWIGSEGKIIMGFLFSFFLPWGILRAIPWVMEGFKEAGVRHSPSQETNQATNNEDPPTESFPAFGDRLDATEKTIKRMKWVNIFIVCLLIFCLTITLNLLTSSKQSRNKVLIAKGLIINDKFGVTRIEINTRRISNKPYIDFLNDKGDYVNSIDETGHKVDVESYIEQFDPPKTQVMPTYPDAKLRKSVPFEPDKFIPDPQKKKLPAWKDTFPIK